MRKLLLAGAFAALWPLGGHAQTAQELQNGANDTANVLNYGMGYSLQRFSPLTQINRQTGKHLVPVWNYSYDDNHARNRSRWSTRACSTSRPIRRRWR